LAAGGIFSEQQIVWAEQLNALIPFFQVKENPVDLSPPDEILMVTIPSTIEKQQFHVSLYQETISLLKKMNEFPRNKG
jgi:hypothetical protein